MGLASTKLLSDYGACSHFAWTACSNWRPVAHFFSHLHWLWSSNLHGQTLSSHSGDQTPHFCSHLVDSAAVLSLPTSRLDHTHSMWRSLLHFRYFAAASMDPPLQSYCASISHSDFSALPHRRSARLKFTSSKSAAKGGCSKKCHLSFFDFTKQPRSIACLLLHSGLGQTAMHCFSHWFTLCWGQILSPVTVFGCFSWPSSDLSEPDEAFTPTGVGLAPQSKMTFACLEKRNANGSPCLPVWLQIDCGTQSTLSHSAFTVSCWAHYCAH